MPLAVDRALGLAEHDGLGAIATRNSSHKRDARLPAIER